MLSESKPHQAKLDELLGVSLALQKLYGRDVANTGTVIELFQRLLSKYPAEKAVRAFELWIERSQEFPTPADIVNLIKRNGKPPMKESDIIAIRKKDGQDRNSDEWALLREWDTQQQDGWSDIPDPVKESVHLQENMRLRQQVIELKNETARLAALLNDTRIAKGLEKPTPSAQDKIINTIRAMKEMGCPEADIETFSAQNGVILEQAMQ